MFYVRVSSFEGVFILFKPIYWLDESTRLEKTIISNQHNVKINPDVL